VLSTIIPGRNEDSLSNISGQNAGIQKRSMKNQSPHSAAIAAGYPKSKSDSRSSKMVIYPARTFLDRRITFDLGAAT
jgi:hypothetical protein